MHRFFLVTQSTVRLAVAALALATLGSYLGGLHWLADLSSHFHVQLAVAATAILAAACMVRVKSAAMLALLCLFLHVWPLLPYLPVEADATRAPTRSLKILMANVHTSNRKYDLMIETIQRQRPDMVALLEVNDRWMEQLEVLETHYPYKFAKAQDDNFGIALLARFPLEDVELRELGHESVSAIVANVTLEGTPVTLLVAHPVPPVGARGSKLRNRQLTMLADVRAEHPDREFILFGDLNTSPWSPHYSQLERQTGLRNAGLGRGLHRTWPAGNPILRIPIDHALVSSGLQVVRYEVGSRVGSDHLPVTLEIALAGSGRLDDVKTVAVVAPPLDPRHPGQATSRFQAPAHER